MSQSGWRYSGNCTVLRRWVCLAAALLVMASFPAFAFEEGSLPSVSDSTATALKNFVAAPLDLAVPFACATMFDTTPPTVGTASSPEFGPATAIPVNYNGMSDTVSGLKSATLWVRANDGGWASTGQALGTESGSISFNPHGVEATYYFAFRLEDNAGNVGPAPSGNGLTSSVADGTPPVITLSGQAQMTVMKDATFADPGATAADALEGDLTSDIAVTGSVNTAQAGTYTLRYNVADSAGNAATEVTRTVTVEGAAAYALAIPSDLQGQVGATIPCPVNIDQAQGLTAYNLSISFNGDLLEVASVTAGTASSGWGAPAVSTGTGSVNLSASGTALGTGSGSVAIVYVTVKEGAETDQTSPLAFASAELNGGAAEVSTENGLFTVNNDTYLWGDVNGDGRVNFADAILILKYRAGLYKKLPKSDEDEGDFEFFAAGDVSGDEPVEVGTVDASLVMRISEGVMSTFPADIDGDGVGPELTDEKAAIKEAVMDEYGDPESVRLISIPGELTLEPGATYEVPVSVDAAEAMRGYSFELVYDSRALEYVNTMSGSLTQDWMDPIVNPLTGKVIVAAASIDAASGQGTLAVLTFRALATVTSGATTRLSFESADLNDGLLEAQKSTGMGEPVVTAVDPKTGAETGGTVVHLTGANLGDVERVLFGNAESTWVRRDETGSGLYAVTPIGSGAVNVTVDSAGGSSTLTRGFTYFIPQVHLTMTPEQAVESGSPIEVPVWVVDLSGGQVSTITFDLRFDPAVFTPKSVGGKYAAAEESALLANKAVTATLSAPGRLRVTISGSPAKSIGSGLLATCHLLAIATEEEAQGLIYISNTVAESAEAKALPSSASLIPE